MLTDSFALSPEALAHMLGALGSGAAGELSASIFDDSILGKELQKDVTPQPSSNSAGSYSGGGSGAGSGSGNPSTEYIVTDGVNTYQFTDTANSSNSGATNSVIEHPFNYENLDVGILMQEPSLILAIAVILEMFLPLGKSFKLDGLMGIFSALGRKVNRPSISAGQRAFAGFFLPALIIFALLSITLTLDLVSGFDSIITLIVLVLILELKFPQDQSILVYRSLHEGFKEKAKQVLSPMVLRETKPLSEMGIAKATCESAILRIFSGWFAIMIWYFLMGLEGAVLMQTVNVLSRTFNYKLKGNYQFGKTIFRVNQLLLFIPALVLMLCLLVSKNPWRHFVYAQNGFKSYPAAVSGMVLGAVGGALNITLGGPRFYQGEIVRLPSVGGTQKPDEQSILYAMRKIRMCGIILLVVSILIDLNF